MASKLALKKMKKKPGGGRQTHEMENDCFDLDSDRVRGELPKIHLQWLI